MFPSFILHVLKYSLFITCCRFWKQNIWKLLCDFSCFFFFFFFHLFGSHISKQLTKLLQMVFNIWFGCLQFDYLLHPIISLILRYCLDLTTISSCWTKYGTFFLWEISSINICISLFKHLIITCYFIHKMHKSLCM